MEKFDQNLKSSDFSVNTTTPEIIDNKVIPDENSNNNELNEKISRSFSKEESEEIIKSIQPNYNQDLQVKMTLKETIQQQVFEHDLRQKESSEADQKEKELKDKHAFIEAVENHVDELDSYSDYKVEDLLSGKEYKKLLKSKKPQYKPVQQQEGPLKVGKMRVARDKKDKEIMQTVKDAGLKEKDYSKVVEKLKKTIAELETAAKKIEATHDFSVPPISEDVREKYLQFLLTTNILNEKTMFNGKEVEFKQRGVSRRGINQDDFLNSYDILHINSGDAPRSIIDVPTQLVYINKLNKIFGSQFIQEADSNLKFTDIDRSICTFLLMKKPDNHNITKIILENLLKKLIILPFSTVESAFRSSNIWIKPEFKSLIKGEIIMMQGLPTYLRSSFNIFVTELLETERGQIFNRTEKLDYVIHISTPGIIEQTLARIIKTMTPMFIYDYFEAIKSIYLFCGLFDAYLNKCTETPMTSEQMIQDMDIIVKVAVMLYQNTRLYQNSTARSLPYYEKSALSEQAQMYYLNHTLVGPQYQLLRCLEKSAIALI
jgi:myosin heavy subunit